MPWIFYTFAAVTLFSVLNITQLSIAKKSKNVRAASFLLSSIASTITALYLIYTGKANLSLLKMPLSSWLVVLIASIFYAIFERVRFVVYRYLDASEATIIGNSSVVITFVGSLILYHENLSITKVLGSILILLALFFVSQSKSRHKRFTTKGLIISLLIFSSVGLASALDKAGTNSFGTSYSIFVWVIPAFFVFLPYIKKTDLKKEIQVNGWNLLFSATINALGFIYYLKALEIAEATKVIPIIQTSTFFTVILAAIFLDEKKDLPRKIICSIAAIIGSILLINSI